MDPRTLLQHFVESMTQLMAVMRQEIDFVRDKRYDDIERLQRHKAKLAKAYETHQSAVYQDTSVFGLLSDGERQELRSLYQAFRETLSENMLALKAAQDATDRVIGMIITGVRKARGVTDTPAPQKLSKPARGYAAYAGAGTASGLMNRTL